MLINRIVITAFIFITPLLLYCSDKTTQPNITIDDGWEIVSPESQGMNESVLNTLTSKIQNEELGLISSLLITRNGKIVYEEYFRSMHKNTKHSIYSVTKSFTSAAIGIAIEEGLINSVDERMLDYFSQYTPPLTLWLWNHRAWVKVQPSAQRFR